MKTLFFFILSALALKADPLIHSWFTDLSGRYARIYEDNDAIANQTPVTTWNRGQGVQNEPVYAGITEVSSTATDVYIRTSNLGYHIMGPWYGGNGNLFPNYPSNRADIFRFPRSPVIPASKTPTDLASIGYGVDGIALFDSRDAFSFDTSRGIDETPGTAQDNTINGDNFWNRDAYTNESDTFDPAFAHQAGNNHHYHANAPALRHLLGDSVDHDPAVNVYTEAPKGAHSPILGWFRDGIPLYGPYGYSDPDNASSQVRRMIGGYQKRDGTNGSTNLAIPTGNTPQGDPTGRTTLPEWVVRNEPGMFPNADLSNAAYPVTHFGPPVSNDYPIGHYLQDYAYKGDLGLTLGTDFDLNEYNVRFCVTPEFPGGTWAYFTNIEPDGTPVYPYNIARYYYGEPSGGSPNTVPGNASVHFEGGPNRETTFNGATRADDEVTLLWSGIEGGEYSIDSSTTLEAGSWNPEANNLEPVLEKIALTARTDTHPTNFYRTKLNRIAPFDQNGINNFNFTPAVVALFHLETSPPLPLEITTASVGGVPATIVNYDPANGLLELCFDDSTLETGDYPAIIDNSISSENTFSVSGPNNVLLLILDDWGIDSSELYNTAGPGIQLANMPTLRNLADNGLLFTRGYSQPICSPTRATLLTGRQPYQHGVGNPGANNTLSAAELTFPEIISAEAPDYGLASFGKWHLGSGNTGAFDTGGWPNFMGTLQGGVPGYRDWVRIKIEEAILIDSGTDITDLVANNTYNSPYATSVQVDEAVSFISGQDNDPWVVWMGFNAPHTPFHDPPSDLAPVGGYTAIGNTDKDLYIRSLEALDTEIARLLAEVDPAKTNIIVIGDNGTPGQVDQAPAGGLARAKGSLNEGGIHVPFFAIGPDILKTGTSDKLVHVADLFSTILDLTGVDIPADVEHHSNSLVPIFNNSDTADRCIIAEVFGQNDNDGRSLIMDDWPNYKLISTQDVSDPEDSPTYQMYLLGSNGMEASTLTTPPNPGDAHEAAYLALIAKDQSLAPGTSGREETVDIDLPANAPPLINVSNGNIVRPTAISIGGVAATWNPGDITADGATTSAARVDESGNPDPFSVVAEFDLAASGLTSGQSYDIIVTFPGGGGRPFTATNQFLVP